ncbi:MLO-like protein 4 isoform X2 [Cinnamomum micranthum f. kanehirae]|uniref:MLO-like protein n=1 Tax=Cinnamomum micranthum f. kanehirae TaxID=337451 RepID=A0A443PVW0_9MAGN|nr:MLO-like protein 4 isoform X2 [Cinnamomum micranthum f. kanehirae]
MEKGRSLAETPTWSVATVTTVMVVICFVVERSIYRFGKWLKKTRRKAVLASLEKIKEELMLLGLISLLLGQWARWISEICVDSSLFSSRFYPCSEEDSSVNDISGTGLYTSNQTGPQETVSSSFSHVCSKGHEPFVSLESLEQLHRFLFLLGITHVLYSCIAVVLAMIKVSIVGENGKIRLTHCLMNVCKLCFVRQFKVSIEKSDYMALRLGFISKHKLPLSYDFHRYMVRSMEDEFHGIVGISWPLWIYAILCIIFNVHGLNVYFWLSFIPAFLVMLVGTKLQHVVAQLALEIVEATGPAVGNQLKPRDDLFWFGKPEILLWLIQFISFQNSFEMATFIWSLWGLKAQSCFMKNHSMVAIRLVSGLLVQFWCSYSTVPLNVIVTQMGSRFKKALLAESVRESLHSWCKRVKEKSKLDSSLSQLGNTQSIRSLESTIDERDEIITVVSDTLSRSPSTDTHNPVSLEDANVDCIEQREIFELIQQDFSVQLTCISSGSAQETLSHISDSSGDNDNDATDGMHWEIKP